MQIKTQKIICFIPIINFAVISFQWLRMYVRNHISILRFIKTLLIMFLFCVFFVVVEYVMRSIMRKDSDLILNFCFGCLDLFIISFIEIYDQERYLKGQNKEN